MVVKSVGQFIEVIRDEVESMKLFNFDKHIMLDSIQNEYHKKYNLSVFFYKTKLSYLLTWEL